MGDLELVGFVLQPEFSRFLHFAASQSTKKADVGESHFRVCDHVGLFFDPPPGTPGGFSLNLPTD